MMSFKGLCTTEKVMLLEVYLAGEILDISARGKMLLTGNKMDTILYSDRLKRMGLVTVFISPILGICMKITEPGKKMVRDNIRLLKEVP